MIKILNFIKGTFFHPQWLSDRYHKLSKQHLTEIHDGIVLDIGSGDSDLSSFLVGDVSIIRLDYPDTNCRYTNNPDTYGDATCLPLVEHSVDVVLLLEVIEHISEYQTVLEEIHRVLKNDGRLYLSAPFIYPAHDVPYDFHRFSIYGLRQDLDNGGFSILSEYQHGNSIVVSLQMLILAILELVKKVLAKKQILGVLFAVSAYPICLIINLFAFPFINESRNNAAVFGHFVIAKPK